MRDYRKDFKGGISPLMYDDKWSLEMPYRATVIIDYMLTNLDEQNKKIKELEEENERLLWRNRNISEENIELSGKQFKDD